MNYMGENMLSIDEKLYNKMPPELRAMFKELPNPERDEVVGEFPDTKGGTAVRHNSGGNTFGGDNAKPLMNDLGYDDSGSASRFFYCAKASKKERNMGCEGLEEKDNLDYEIDPEHPYKSGKRNDNNANQLYMGVTGKPPTKQANHHSTVKPISLMKYLCRLITPPEGIVLDPYAGSGSTGIACKIEGFKFVGIERDKDYINIASKRIAVNRLGQEVLF